MYRAPPHSPIPYEPTVRLLGMDDRAARQHFSWPAGGQVATLSALVRPVVPVLCPFLGLGQGV